MVGHVHAWFVRALSTLALLGSTGLVLSFVAGGFSEEHRAADVSTVDTLRHLLAGEGEPRMPVSEGDLQGTFPVLPPPTTAELQANLEKSHSSGHLQRFEHSLARN